jgi:PAS domain S-box-containing protein
MGVPMISGGNMIGVIIFENQAPHVLAPADEQVAAAFANQVGVALENARLFEEVAENASELHSRTQRLALLNRISSTIGQSLDQTSILQTAVDELTLGLSGERGDVYMLEQGGDTARLSIQYPSTPDGTVDEVTIPIKTNPAVEWLLRERRPMPVEDVTTDERVEAMRQQLTDRGATSALLVPLTIGNNLNALIAIHNEKPREFNTDQIELAQTVTNQVAVSIQNAQLFQETVARQRELSILFEAGRIASASLDLNTVANNAANYFNRSLDVDGSAIYLVEAQTLTSLADVEKRTGENHPRNSLPLADYPALRSVVNDRGVVALRREDEALSEPERDYLQTRDTHTALMVPLTARDEIIGVAELRARSKSRNFTQGDIKLVRALAASIATAMENARLHDETQQRLDELAIINEISRGLTQTISQEDLFRILQEQIADVLNANSLTIARYDERTDVWTFPLAIENNERVDRAPSAGRNLYSYVAQTREPLILRGSIEEFREENDLIDAVSAAQSFAAVPLQTGEKVMGVMALEDYTHTDAFSDTDLRVLGPIAAQVAVSIENTRLYGELQQRLSETTTLQEVSRVVNSALDLQEIFERVVNELADAFQYPIVGLYTLEGRELLMQASQGYGDEDNIERMRVIGVDEGIIGRVVTSGVGEYVVDVRSDDDYIPVEGWVRSMVAVPIISDEFVLGVLTVQAGADRLLGENDLELLRTFAGQVATAMVNASLYTQMVELSEELERRVDERTEELSAERDRIDTLFRITVELTASLDLDRVLNRALSLVGQAIGAEYGALFLVDPQSDLLIYRAAMQESEIIPPGGRQIEMRKDTGMAGWVMKNRQSLIVGNVTEDERWAAVPGTEERRSLLGAPLISSETVLGCLFFTSNEIDKFNQGHLQLVEAAANQVATAINNAELYRLIRDQAERLGVMLRSQQTEAAKSQAILESIADGVMVSDSTGEIILFNAAAERILDLRRDEVLGRPAADLTGLYGEGAQVWADMLDSFDETASDLESGEFVTAQLQIGNKYVQVNVAAVMHGAENLGLVSVFRDITREVAADRAKSEFVANVSHELRTPMTSIKGYADLLLLQAAGDINDDQRRFLTVIKQNADRLTSLVNDLLTISSIEQRDIELDIRDIDVSEVINDVVFAIEGRMSGEGAKQVNIDTEIADELTTIEGDYDRITQIVTNLVSNSYQYTEDGGQIVISAYEEAGGVRIDVADTGIGIPYEQQDRIFERFFRGVENPMVMATAGTGLGLSIVQHLIDMHSGRISFESEPGVGTTFSVWLPDEFTEDAGDNLDAFTAIRE